MDHSNSDGFKQWRQRLLEDEPAWQRFQDVVLEFTGADRAQSSGTFAALSEREREILAQIVAGKTNQEIGDALFISEKTVRNHITHIYEKLGVKTRAQAMVQAREQGFESG
jgi:DNA-binding CsgD family transcriptional regulator